ncbi:hypothetical protein JD844_003777 [Phrynosoma platyrhinos]|uniref:BED-type domain-containing protein n=1 Tax=Phrynosoma platyrhinos TaxID=52577 RepID=A0ABQ7TE44_PHRPL|nr:hypothetical protein JD844_003777 [Phrynosoma platyrhinos]
MPSSPQTWEWDVEPQHLPSSFQPPAIFDQNAEREIYPTAEISLWTVVATIQAVERKVDSYASRLLNLEGRTATAEKKIFECEKTELEFSNHLAALGTLIQEYGWANLEDWQKELYKNITKGKYEPLISLDSAISKAEIPAQTEQAEPPPIVDQGFAEGKGFPTEPRTESEPLASKDNLLSWIKQEEPPSKEKWDLEGESPPVLGYVGSSVGAAEDDSQLDMKIPMMQHCHNTEESPMVITEVQVPQDPVPEEEEESREMQPTPPASRPQVPWSGFEKAFTFVRQRGKNVIVQCNYCLPLVKHLSSAFASASNLKKHLERAHPGKLSAIERARKARRRGYSEELRQDMDPTANKFPRQQRSSLGRWGSGSETLTQQILDRKIMDFIIEETLPLETVDKPSYMMEALLKAEIRSMVGEDNAESSERDQEGDDLEDDFFNLQPRGKKSGVDTVDEEVWRYLKSPSREVSSLHAFPHVMQCFLQYNTGVPSSAAVEHLLSTGGSLVASRKHPLSDELFEQLFLLKQNKGAF